MNVLKMRLGLLVLLVTAMFAGAHAQTSNGTIVGTVVDATGAAVPGATVTAVSNETGETRTAKTNSSGGYRIESVTPGTFNVTAAAPSFEKTTLQKVRVDASVLTSVNETLKAGAQETIEVSTEKDTLDTDSGSISGRLGAVAVDNLPVGSLNPYELALTLPGVQNNNPAEAFTNGVGFSVNGGRARANNFLIEGSDNNDSGLHGQGLQPENLDAVDEVVVLLSGYQAEFGGGGGSVSNYILKNGSNQFHGAVWDRLLNSSLDSNDKSVFYSQLPITQSRENIFGYDIGGYALKNKLFFFTSLQFDRFRGTPYNTLILPTPSGVATLDSLLPNPRISTLLQAYNGLTGQDPTAAQIAGTTPYSVYFACLNIAEATPATAQCPFGGAVAVGPYVRKINIADNSSELDNKVEYIATQKDTVSFRYIRSPGYFPYDTGGLLPGFDTYQNGTAHNAGITETHIFSPNMVNELRLSYGRIGFFFNLLPSTYANPLGTAPTTAIGGVEGFGAPGGEPQQRSHNTFQLQDAFSWNIGGRNALKLGFDILNVRVRDDIPFNYYGSISYAGDLDGAANGGGDSGLGNYIDDFGGDGGSAAIDYGNPIVRPQFWKQNYYIQDAWKATKDLTIDAGFRYEYSGDPFNSEQFPAFDINNPACTAPGFDVSGNPIYCNVQQVADKGDYGPRFGFAYSPEYFGKKTVLRGGFGIYYDGLFTNIIDNTQASTPNALSPEVISQAPFGGRGVGNLSAAFTDGALDPVPNAQNTIVSMSPNIRSPRTLQWNLNVQQDLGAGFTSQIAYVGSRGEHLYATTESNPFIDTGGDRLFNGLGRVILRDNSGDSVYHSAQVELNRSFQHGFLMRASYTWSKFEDDVSEIFTSGTYSTYGEEQYPFARKQIDYGQSALDVRNRLVISYVYAPPIWHPEGFTKKVAAAIVNGFQFSGVQQFNSGNPGNIEIGFDNNADGIGNDRPQLANPNAPLATYAIDITNFGVPAPGTYCDGPTAIYEGICNVVTLDQVHFLIPAYGTNPPKIQRNSFHTLGNQEADVSVQRTFHIHESQNFLFRAEGFNVLNQGNTGVPNLTLLSITPDPSFGVNTFGQFAPTVSGSRTLRFYAKYSF